MTRALIIAIILTAAPILAHAAAAPQIDCGESGIDYLYIAQQKAQLDTQAAVLPGGSAVWQEYKAKELARELKRCAIPNPYSPVCAPRVCTLIANLVYGS